MKKPAFWGAAAGVLLAGVSQNALGHGLSEAIAVFDPAHAEIGWSAGFAVYMGGGAAFAVSLKRGFLGAKAGFWHSVPGRWLIGRLAGTGIAALLAEPVLYAVKTALQYALLGAYYAGGLDLALALMKGYWPCAYALTALVVWKLRTPVKIAIGKASRPLRRWYRSLGMGGGGSAGFASIVEEWGNRWRPGMIFLGHSLHDRHWPVGVRDDRMMMTLAGNGGGKGETAIIPNLLRYPGSVFCNDTKEQNAAVTAEARRRDLGQDVYVLAPFAKETAHLNPLDGIDPEAPDYVERIKGIVEALVIAGDDKNRVWSEWSKIVIEGLTDFEIRYDDGEFEPPEEAENAE